MRLLASGSPRSTGPPSTVELGHNLGYRDSCRSGCKGRRGGGARNFRSPVIAILVEKRRYATIEFDYDAFHGPCNGYNPEGCWAIPTAFVEPTDANAIGTLARALWMNLGFQVKEIVGCCSDITEVSVIDGKRFRKITYILTTDEVGEVTPPRWSEHEGLEWMQFDHFDGRRGVRLTLDGTEGCRETYRIR